MRASKLIPLVGLVVGLPFVGFAAGEVPALVCTPGALGVDPTCSPLSEVTCPAGSTSDGGPQFALLDWSFDNYRGAGGDAGTPSCSDATEYATCTDAGANGWAVDLTFTEGGPSDRVEGYLYCGEPDVVPSMDGTQVRDCVADTEGRQCLSPALGDEEFPDETAWCAIQYFDVDQDGVIGGTVWCFDPLNPSRVLPTVIQKV